MLITLISLVGTGLK